MEQRVSTVLRLWGFLSPCDTIKATYDVISRQVAQDFFMPDRQSGKLDFFFPASDDDISTAVVWPVSRLLSDVVERCSLMLKGDNPRLPRDALLSVGAGLPTLRTMAADAASVSLYQPVLTPIPDLTPSVPTTVAVPRKHFTLLQQSAANASSAITDGSGSLFLDDDTEELHLLQSALAFLSRDLAVMVSTVEVNLRLLVHDAYQAASTLPLTVKDVCRRSEIRPQVVFGPSALQAFQDHRDAFTSHVFDHDRLCQGDGLCCSPSASVSMERARASWTWSSGSPAAAASTTATAVSTGPAQGTWCFSQAYSRTETWTRSAAVGVDHACSGYLHSVFLTFL